MNYLDTISGNVAETFLFTAAALSLVFIVLYQLLARWERSPFGVHTMVSHIILFLILTLGVGASIFGDNFPGRQEMRLLIFLACVVVLIHQIYLLLREQINSRSAPPTKKKEDHHGIR